MLPVKLWISLVKLLIVIVGLNEILNDLISIFFACHQKGACTKLFIVNSKKEHDSRLCYVSEWFSGAAKFEKALW